MVEAKKNGRSLEGNTFTGWKGLHRVNVELLGNALVIVNKKLLFPERRKRWGWREEEDKLQTLAIRPHFHPFGRRTRFVKM